MSILTTTLLFIGVFIKVDWLNKLIEYMWPYLDKVCFIIFLDKYQVA